MSIIGDMFFESSMVTADLLLEEQGVGAAIALRVRVSSAAKNIRGITPGLFLYIGATPGLVSAGGHDNPGGTTPAPNTPQVGWTLCADSYCDAVLRHGPMAAFQGITSDTLAGSAGAAIGRWYTVTLEVTDNMAAGWIDKVEIFSKVSIAPSPLPPPPPPPPLPPSSTVHQCIENTTLLANDTVIAGGDYRQVMLLPSGNASTDIQDCSKACCADGACSAWAIAKGKCWLKHHGWSISKMVGGEDACAIRPVGPTPAPTPAPPASPSPIPPSGWAAIAATIGRSQVDNFKLTGTTGGGAAVPPCGSAAPETGSPVVTTPCDYPGTVAGWTVSRRGAIQLGQRGSSPGADSSSGVSAASEQLCVGVTANTTQSGGSAITLVACGSESAFVYSATTGRISPRGNGSHCATAVQRTFNDTAAATMVLSACAPIPSETQQFQYNPSTGALRPKASSCITTSQGEATRVQYRDCCIALCRSK